MRNHKSTIFCRLRTGHQAPNWDVDEDDEGDATDQMTVAAPSVPVQLGPNPILVQQAASTTAQAPLAPVAPPNHGFSFAALKN
jgi:hypothetical protein